MYMVTQGLAEEIQGAVLGYMQSDEVSILAIDNQKHESEPWFGKNVQKIASVSAAIATMKFNIHASNVATSHATFDARCFVLPEDEVTNYFIYRQQDATRNSINGYCLSEIGKKHGKKTAMKMLHGKNSSEQQELLFQETGLNWNDLPSNWNRGVALVKGDLGWQGVPELPIFTQDRNFIESKFKNLV